MKKLLSSTLLILLAVCFLISPNAALAKAENGDVDITSKSGIVMD